MLGSDQERESERGCGGGRVGAQGRRSNTYAVGITFSTQRPRTKKTKLFGAGPNRFEAGKKTAAQPPGCWQPFSRPEFLRGGEEPQTVEQRAPLVLFLRDSAVARQWDAGGSRVPGPHSAGFAGPHECHSCGSGSLGGCRRLLTRQAHSRQRNSVRSIEDSSWSFLQFESLFVPHTRSFSLYPPLLGRAHGVDVMNSSWKHARMMHA